jgi:hypothetical protein
MTINMIDKQNKRLANKYIEIFIFLSSNNYRIEKIKGIDLHRCSKFQYSEEAEKVIKEMNELWIPRKTSRLALRAFGAQKKRLIRGS